MLLNFLQDYGGSPGGGAFGGLGVAADDEAQRQRRLGLLLQNVTPAEVEAMRRADARTPPAPALTLDHLMAQEADRTRRTFGDPANIPLASQATPSLIPPGLAQDIWNRTGDATASGIRTLAAHAGLATAEAFDRPTGDAVARPGVPPPPLTRDALGLTMGSTGDFGSPRQSAPVAPNFQFNREAFGLVPEQVAMPRPIEAGEGRGGGSPLSGGVRGGDGALAATPKPPEAVAQPDPLALLTQRGTFDQFDRYTPSPFEQRLAQLTGVAYGQMPLQFDPRLRTQVAQQMAGEGLANADLASKRDLLQMQLAAQERLANSHNANQLAVAQMTHQPHPRTISGDLLVKMIANSQAADPTGASMQQTFDAYKAIAPQFEAMLAASQRSDPNAIATERPGFGAPPVTPPLTPQAGPSRVAALLQSMRNVASTTKQNEVGQTVYDMNPATMEEGGQGPARLAQIYAQANLSPAETAEFRRLFEAGRRGGIGEPSQLRQAVAIETAKAYLQSKNFGRELQLPNGAYPQTLAIPSPSDPSATLLTLGTSPLQGAIPRTLSDAFEAAMTNPLALIDPDQPGVIPWNQIAVPGSGTVDFKRGRVTPTFNQSGVRQAAQRDLPALLKLYSDIAQQQIPQPVR